MQHRDPLWLKPHATCLLARCHTLRLCLRKDTCFLQTPPTDSSASRGTKAPSMPLLFHLVAITTASDNLGRACGDAMLQILDTVLGSKPLLILKRLWTWLRTRLHALGVGPTGRL